MRFSKKAQEIISFSVSLDPRYKYHFANEPLGGIRSVPANAQGTQPKPIGLWYSWGGAWPIFLLGDYAYRGSKEGKWATDRIESINYVYRVNVDFNDVLRIRRKKDFEWICNQYGKPSTHPMAKYDTFPCDINWKKFSRDYKGIDIRYDAEMACEHHWYFGWDCHSGCVWRTRAIKDYKEVWNYKQGSL